MNKAHTLLKAVAASIIMLSAAQAHAATPTLLTITDVSGAARIQQGLPCGNTLDVTTSIVRGYMSMSWLQTTRGGEVQIDMTRLNMLMSPFHVDASCNGVRGSVDFREIGVQLASAIRFKAQLVTSGRDSSLVRFSIPKEKFLIYQSVIDNVPVRQPESSYQRPSEDVTGLIDLRRQTVQLHVVLTPELRFRVGCVDGRCAMDEKHKGTITTDVRGGDFSTTPAPVVKCGAARLANSFEVNASDKSSIALGSYALANNEVIQLLQSKEPGVRLIPSTSGGSRQFQVGPGEAFIIAKSPANVSAMAYCK
jgi:hypothetical protein